MPHIQRTQVQTLMKEVANGHDPYKAANEVIDLIQRNYIVRSEDRVMTRSHIDILLMRIESIILSTSEPVQNDTYPYYRKGFNDAAEASIRMIKDLADQVLDRKD